MDKDTDKGLKILKSCKNEGSNSSGKWVFNYEDLEVECVSVFAVHQYVSEDSDLSFRNWLYSKEWTKIK